MLYQQHIQFPLATYEKTIFLIGDIVSDVIYGFLEFNQVFIERIFFFKTWFFFDFFFDFFLFGYRNWRFNIAVSFPRYLFWKRWLGSFLGKFGFGQKFSNEKSVIEFPIFLGIPIAIGLKFCPKIEFEKLELVTCSPGLFKAGNLGFRWWKTVNNGGKKVKVNKGGKSSCWRFFNWLFLTNFFGKILIGPVQFIILVTKDLLNFITKLYKFPVMFFWKFALNFCWNVAKFIIRLNGSVSINRGFLVHAIWWFRWFRWFCGRVKRSKKL